LKTRGGFDASKGSLNKIGCMFPHIKGSKLMEGENLLRGQDGNEYYIYLPTDSQNVYQVFVFI